MIDLKHLTIKKARAGLDRGDFTAVDLASAYLEEIKKSDNDVHAFLEVYEDVLDQAVEADKKIKAGEKGRLLGIPLALKDNILIKERRVGAASKILEGYVATYDATAVSKLKSAGAVFIGRANMDEFAMGSSTENSAYGVTKNPHDLSRVAGGSSGGSVAAVAGNMALVALGSDTGGSVRQPASFCGVVGFKPSYGAVSRSGLMAMGSSLDVIGSIGKSVSDVKEVFDVIRGVDRLDGTSVNVSEKSERFSKAKPRVANLSKFIEEVGQGGIDPEVMKNYGESLKRFEEIGYEIVEPKTDLSALKYSLPAYYVIMPAEVSTNLARFDGVKYGFHKEGENLLDDYMRSRGEGFGKEPRRRIILGTYVLSSGYYESYYGKATALRGIIKKTFQDVFGEVDLIATPTAPTPAFKIGSKTSDPLEMYLADIFTITANMVGVPAISLPSGFKEVEGKKLPIGFQLMAPYLEDNFLLRAGADFLGEN